MEVSPKGRIQKMSKNHIKTVHSTCRVKAKRRRKLTAAIHTTTPGRGHEYSFKEELQTKMKKQTQFRVAEHNLKKQTQFQVYQL